MKRLAGLLVSGIVLLIIWWSIDTRAIAEAARGADLGWLAAGIAITVPLTLATAWRFQLIGRTPLPFGSALRLILAASTLNLILPSKLGDLAKAWVLNGRYGFDQRLALALVVFEKVLDMASLLLLGVAGALWLGQGDPLFLLAAAGIAGLLAPLLLLVAPVPLATRLMAWVAGLAPGKLKAMLAGFADHWDEVVGWFWQAPARAAGVLALTLLLWAGHLAQFWLFAMALGHVPFLANMAYATLSILAGLLPFTLAGIGTRDAAIVLFYDNWLGAGGGAVLGVLATLRYVLPALFGLPFMRDYWDRSGARARGA